MKLKPVDEMTVDELRLALTAANEANRRLITQLKSTAETAHAIEGLALEAVRYAAEVHQPSLASLTIEF